MMKARAHLLVLLCLLGVGVAVVVAQSPPAVAPPPPPFGRTMSTVIAVAIVGSFFLLLFLVYINDRCNVAPAGPSCSCRSGERGLDPALVATFPIVAYRGETKTGRAVTDCAVCLTAFEEGNELRLLPHCSHAFHPECIDRWLQARTTCPLCRASLEKPPHAVAIAIPPAQQVEEATELRSQRWAARLPRSNSTGHSLFVAPAAAADHERFMQVLMASRLRLIDLSSLSPEGGSRGGWGAGIGGSFGNAGGGGGRSWPARCRRPEVGATRGSVRKEWDRSTRRGRDDSESSRTGAPSPGGGAAMMMSTALQEHVTVQICV